MTSFFSTPQLIELVHRYYPANLSSTDPDYDKSTEYQSLVIARRQALAQHSNQWTQFVQHLQEALPDCEVEDWTVLWDEDNCWRVRVYLPEPVDIRGEKQFQAVVLLVSILAPVYVLYSSFQLRTAGGQFRSPTIFYEEVPETKRVAEVVGTLVQRELDVQRLSNETLFVLIPDIQCRNVELGQAKLIDCLFTDDRW